MSRVINNIGASQVSARHCLFPMYKEDGLTVKALQGGPRHQL